MIQLLWMQGNSHLDAKAAFFKSRTFTVPRNSSEDHLPNLLRPFLNYSISPADGIL